MTRHPDGQDPRPQDQAGGGADVGEGTEGTAAVPAAAAGTASARASGRPGRSGSEKLQRPERPGGIPRTGPAVERVQTGVRMEKRLVKVLKALAELYDLSLGDLLEGIVLHAFAGRTPFSPPSLRRIAVLERIYGLDPENPEPGPGVRPLPAIEASDTSDGTERPAG